MCFKNIHREGGDDVLPNVKTPQTRNKLNLIDQKFLSSGDLYGSLILNLLCHKTKNDSKKLFIFVFF